MAQRGLLGKQDEEMACPAATPICMGFKGPYDAKNFVRGHCVRRGLPPTPCPLVYMSDKVVRLYERKGARLLGPSLHPVCSAACARLLRPFWESCEDWLHVLDASWDRGPYDRDETLYRAVSKFVQVCQSNGH